MKLPNLTKSSKPRLAIYTAIFGDKNELIDPHVKLDNCDLICFSDQNHPDSKKYQVQYYPQLFPDDPNRSAKVFKMLPHYFLPNYEYSIWIDGRIIVKESRIYDFALDAIKNHPWAMYQHPAERSVDQELAKCIEWELGDPEVMTNQIEQYQNQGFDTSVTIPSGGIIIRKHFDPNVIQIGEDWWQEVRQHSKRDQLSFSYVVWKNKFAWEIVPGNINKNKFFAILKHKDNPKFQARKDGFLKYSR